MLIKCETKSYRVKGLSLHPILSWVLVSLNNGIIELWDYKLSLLIDRFEGHDGPVRGVHFHPNQPIFVSGGDDYKIKVWNYTQRNCIFTLTGHMDYIRHVNFHHEYPWILSASDDQTARIWNWQSRSCLAVLTGHSHYVMSCQFHPKDDLVLTASLDQTIRIWDICTLRKNNVTMKSGDAVMTDFNDLQKNSKTLFSFSSIICKFVLEGHSKGVNFACFHHSLPFVASASDDFSIILWRYNEVKWWELETFKGHLGNVSSVVFHPTKVYQKDLLLSNSEDKTIRIWDLVARNLIYTYKKDTDRFWCLANYSSSNIFAAGHDSGMCIFKIHKERMACDVYEKFIYCVNDQWISAYNMITKKYTSLIACSGALTLLSSGPYSIRANKFNTASVNLLIAYNESQFTGYHLISIPNIEALELSRSSLHSYQGHSLDIAFISKNTFASLDSSSTILIINLKNEIEKKIQLNIDVQKIFSGGNNILLMKSGTKVYAFDIKTEKIIHQYSCSSGVRSCVASLDMTYLALLSKNYIALIHNFKLIRTIYSNTCIKSGIWDSNGVFLYSTLTHIKYCLPYDDEGLLKSIESVVYLINLDKDQLWYSTITQSIESMTLDCSEYMLKLALNNQDKNKIAQYISTTLQCPDAWISYLWRKKFYSIGLELAVDPYTKLNFALKNNESEEAFAIIASLNQESQIPWENIANEALMYGMYSLAESIYQHTENYQKLAFLYLISGHLEKLNKLLKITKLRHSTQSYFLNTVLLCKFEDQVQILAKSDQLSLAFLTTKFHGLNSLESTLQDSFDMSEINKFLDNSNYNRETQLSLTSPTPLRVDNNLDEDTYISDWPKIKLESNVYNEKLISKYKHGITSKETNDIHAKKTDLFDDSKFNEDFKNIQVDPNAWNDFQDIGSECYIKDSVDKDAKECNEVLKYDCIEPGINASTLWQQNLRNYEDYIHANKFEYVINTLTHSIGLRNPDPLYPIFQDIRKAMFVSLPVSPYFPSKKLPLLKSDTILIQRQNFPKQFLTMKSFFLSLQKAHQFFSAGKLDQALTLYKSTLQSMCLFNLSENDTEENKKYTRLLKILYSYILAIRIEVERQKILESNPCRAVELAVYLGCAKLETPHQFLTKRRALTVTWKAQNYNSAAFFAKKITTMDFGKSIKNIDETLQQAQKVLGLPDKKKSDKYNINFQPSDIENLIVCGSSLMRIDCLESTVSCSFCKAKSKAVYEGTLCSICDLSELK